MEAKTVALRGCGRGNSYVRVHNADLNLSVSGKSEKTISAILRIIKYDKMVKYTTTNNKKYKHI